MMHAMGIIGVVFVQPKMRLNQLLLVIAVTVVALGLWRCDGCLEFEKDALLQIRSTFGFPAEELSSDCCNWTWIKCDSDTGRVVGLYPWFPHSEDWYLNASLFLPFDELRSLILSSNGFVGCVEDGGLEKLSALHHLKFLDLSYNYFNKSILSSLNGFPSLELLSLRNNNFEGTINLQGLSNLRVLLLDNISPIGTNNGIAALSLGALPSLKILYLRFNNFEGRQIFSPLSQSLEELFIDGSTLDEKSLESFGTALPSLKRLSLTHLPRPLSFQGEQLKSFHYHNSSFLQTVGTLSSLKTLSLPHCSLTGTLASAQGLCMLKHLQELDMSSNNLHGELPKCLANLTSLKVLDLSWNGFSGDISLSPLGSLTSLRDLRLSGNNFQIPASLGLFFNHSNLKHFDGENNRIYAAKEVLNLEPKFQLQTISLSGGGYAGAFPHFFYNQHDLQYVDLSHAKMIGELPSWFLGNNTNMRKLWLVNCSLSGPFQLANLSSMNLEYLDISDNLFNGCIPAEIGASLQRLKFLNLSANGFAGNIPSSVGNISLLEALDISNNRLSGEIPEHLAKGCLSLRQLWLSNNNLQGQMLPARMNLRNLGWMQLDGNEFSGQIPGSLSNCSLLTMLDLSFNSISGKIPRWISNMSILEVLDLSNNNLSGTLPYNFVPPYLQHAYLSKNRLQGPLPGALFGKSELVTLDLSHNDFTDVIPGWLGNFSQLSYLLLSHNNLRGEIPIQLCNLSMLSLIDLSNNNLSGPILSCLRTTSDLFRQTDPSIAPVSAFSVAPTGSQEQPVEFTTKNNSYRYQGEILFLISGIDLSSNSLTGDIPPEFGNLIDIRVLNLSHNRLIGPIPGSFSNLRQLESLDLSHNNLDGEIPQQLTQLNFLAVFNVAYNNLSGKTLGTTGQFSTFNERSYEGNPFLCGFPLPRRCNAAVSPSPLPRTSANVNEQDNNFMDMGVFYVSFLASYAIMLLAIAAILYINPYWRRAWFYFIQEMINSCYFFLVDNLPVPYKFKVLQPCV